MANSRVNIYQVSLQVSVHRAEALFVVFNSLGSGYKKQKKSKYHESY